MPPSPLSIDRSIGAVLSAHRSGLGLTIGDVACRLGIDPTDVKAVELGAERPTPIRLVAWCRLLDLPIGSLFRKAIALADPTEPSCNEP